MNQKTSDRALRMMVASLLESGLTAQEIREVARSLEEDRAFIEQLVRLAVAVADGLRPTPARKQTRARVPKQVPKDRERGADAKQSERRSLVRLLEIMDLDRQEMIELLQRSLRKSMPDATWKPGPRWSRSQIARSFVDLASEEALEEARALLRTRIKPDAYLDGLLQKAG